MGNRNNVIIYQPNYAGEEETQPLYLYSHWDGNDLAVKVMHAIDRAGERLRDPHYFSRIMFEEMIKDSLGANTSYGICVGVAPDHDPENTPITITWQRSNPGSRLIEWEMFVEWIDGIKREAREFSLWIHELTRREPLNAFPGVTLDLSSIEKEGV